MRGHPLAGGSQTSRYPSQVLWNPVSPGRYGHCPGAQLSLSPNPPCAELGPGQRPLQLAQPEGERHLTAPGPCCPEPSVV